MHTSIRPIKVSQNFDITTKVLWQAVTDKDKMVQWFFENIPDFKAEKGFKTEFTVVSGEREFVHSWTVIEAIAPKKLVLDWSYKGFIGQGIAEFLIDNLNEGSKLTIIFKGIESFPNHIPEFTRESCLNGWNHFIKERLVSYFDSK